jgi:lysyl-tRNA synthetase class 2
MGRIFRNEGMSVKHNPEFTSVEIYKAYADYTDMMNLTEDLIVKASESVLGTNVVEYQGEKLDLSPGWARMTMIEAVLKYTGVDFSVIETDAQAREAAKKAGVTLKEGTSWGDALNEVFEQRVESNLKQPTFILNYPTSVSPLAKRIPENPRLTYRFELFIMAREIANAFSELNDPIDQKERFMDQSRQRLAGDEEAHMMDEEFVFALEAGMPPTGGLGIGIDRLVMLLTDSYSIKDVILFPTMKPFLRS